MNEIEKAIDWFKRRKNMQLDDKCQQYENIAIQALQEKAERTPATVISSEDDFYHFCSKCNNEVYKKDKYCHTCGCELKWGIK